MSFASVFGKPNINVRDEMKERLEVMTYRSKMRLGQRHLQDHHIDAILNTLVPYVEELLTIERNST